MLRTVQALYFGPVNIVNTKTESLYNVDGSEDVGADGTLRSDRVVKVTSGSVLKLDGGIVIFHLRCRDQPVSRKY